MIRMSGFLVNDIRTYVTLLPGLRVLRVLRRVLRVLRRVLRVLRRVRQVLRVLRQVLQVLRVPEREPQP